MKIEMQNSQKFGACVTSSSAVTNQHSAATPKNFRNVKIVLLNLLWPSEKLRVGTNILK